jgi:tRNA A-37 threonylcarbamoyl transferase component Bud32
MEDRRSKKPLSDEKLYKLDNLNKKITKERRKDELDRLIEVRQQKKVWHNIMLFCAAINLILIAFAIVGYVNNV